MESFCVQLEKEYLVFSAAHFITFNGDICERLHGHNWRVRAEVEGPLDENRYVIDFILLRDTLKRLTDGLDHHVLLPRDHRSITVQQGPTETTATFEDRRWVFPNEDCVVLPVTNTTAEEIARYLAHQLLEVLHRQHGFRPERLQVDVDENFGQWACYQWRPEA